MRARIAVFLHSGPISAVGVFTITSAGTNPFNKAQVGDRIRTVEKGIDDFEKYLTTRGRKRKGSGLGAAKSRGRQSAAQGANAEKRMQEKDQAGKKAKDDLQEAMDDLNGPTNRLRRKFDPSANYLETKVQMEQVPRQRAPGEPGGGQKRGRRPRPQRLWTALRASINDLARCYNLTPVGT